MIQFFVSTNLDQVGPLRDVLGPPARVVQRGYGRDSQVVQVAEGDQHPLIAVGRGVHPGEGRDGREGDGRTARARRSAAAARDAGDGRPAAAGHVARHQVHSAFFHDL